MPFCFCDKLKYKNRNKALDFCFYTENLDIKHKTRFFFDSQNNWTLKFKLEVQSEYEKYN